VPVPSNAIDRPQPIALLLAPARPLPAAPRRPQSNLPTKGGADAPHAEMLWRSGTQIVRGVIGQTATVGGNAAHIGAPGIAGIAESEGEYNARAAVDAIGRHVDRRV
jgi:hypothetical protein